MAGTPDDSGYPGAASGQMNPELLKFVGSMQTDAGRLWAQDAASKIQDYDTTKTIATQARDDANQTVTDLGNAKQGLVGLVTKDPGAIDLALGLVPSYINSLVDQHQHLDEDQRAGAASSMISDMQSEIAHAGVQRIAQLDKDQALEAIDTYGKYIPPDQQEALKLYTHAQDDYRTQDGVAARGQDIRDRALAGYQSASNYLGSLTDDSGSMVAPASFIQSVLNDHSLALPTKLALHAGYVALQTNGDPPQSNPHVLADMIQRLGDSDPPQQGEIISHLGTNLSLADAQTMNTLIAPRDAQQQASIRQLSGAVQQARDTLLSGGNSRVGQPGFGRFMSWLMPELRNGADVGSLLADNRLQQFAPTAADFVPQRQGPRPPLHQIFSGNS